MEYSRKSKMPFFVFFLIYWIYYDIIWSILTTFAISLLEYLKGGVIIPFFHVLLDVDNMIWLIFLLPMFITAYYTMGSMVESISIDAEKKIVKVIYYPLFFWKKEKRFFIDNTFKCHYDSQVKSIYTYIKSFNLLYFNILQFYKGDKILEGIILHDVAGWKSDQIEKIYDEFDRIKKCNEQE